MNPGVDRVESITCHSSINLPLLAVGRPQCRNIPRVVQGTSLALMCDVTLVSLTVSGVHKKRIPQIPSVKGLMVFL